MWMPTDSRGNNFNDMSMPMLIKVISAAASASGSHVRMVYYGIWYSTFPRPKVLTKRQRIRDISHQRLVLLDIMYTSAHTIYIHPIRSE